MTIKFTSAVLFLIAVCCVKPLRAQVAPVTQEDAPACYKVLESLGAPDDSDAYKMRVANFVQMREQGPCLLQLLLRDERVKTLIEQKQAFAAVRMAYQAQKSSNTTQVGSTAGTGGTTSAISKPASATSIATEYGGITSSSSGQTVTFQTTLDAFEKMRLEKGQVVYCTPTMWIPGCKSQKTLDYLGRVGLGVSLNTASASNNNVKGSTTGNEQGTTEQVSLRSIGSQVPSFATAFLKYTIIKPHTKELPKIDASKIAVHPMLSAMRELDVMLAEAPGYQDWQTFVMQQMAAASASGRMDVFNKYYLQIVPILLDGAVVDRSANPDLTEMAKGGQLSQQQSALVSEVAVFVASENLTAALFDEAVAKAAGSPILGIEYDYNTPTNQPTNSTIKLTGSVGWKTFKPSSNSGSTPNPAVPLVSLTYNGGVSLYNSDPAATIPGASVLRDVQAGAEIDYNIATSKLLPGILAKLGDSTASVTYYFQYQSSPSILNVKPGSPYNGITITGLPSDASQIFAEKGNIHVFQVRYGFGTGTSVRFPIAVTYSNRSELIVHRTWGLQFGVTYDLSALFGGAGKTAN